ncbi:hypothetical protein SERLA73DRAFT_75586 [Serpula lacrymans var. lacrymans S7.3]|uniref:DDE Tnp4 domain-containing protein n=2 Tax=Serpula lacrymans var. lacrymans TaxID=341189 RepID=F8Q585_SERL3|nr:uncharacterized protein SERLADRAFT_440349 [Serpula lacrymans var. lacrymans S7.9]EGN96712.1 hypothetical protein SERLA73DRAFT_75586 [Serpula lacrymans var. lacrymans S7.3]EGO22324.1 hypothetical protein SERLADRAFT_440349 [Serpula lacrymans var. lacrymans S7.9]
MSVQAKIPPAVCMLHNFIRTHDPSDIDAPNDIDLHIPTPKIDNGELAQSAPTEAGRVAANTQQDRIARAMWIDYQRELALG